MIEKYAKNFGQLTPDAENLIATALLKRYPDIEPLSSVYETCVMSRIDQADVVMSIANDPSPLAVLAIETVVGKPIVRGHPCLRGPAKKPRTEPVEKRTRAPRAAPSDPRVISYVEPNPKKPGSKSYDRYQNYQVGMTVSQALAAGVSREDIKYDTNKGFIRFEGEE